MQVYIFGNKDSTTDNIAIQISKKLKKDFPELEFIYVKPNEDVPFTNQRKIYLLDVIAEISKILLFSENDLDKLILSPRSTVHDFDLCFQLKYLKKLKKLPKLIIVGLPQKKQVDYSYLKSIFKKLVAQDMQGS